MSVNNLNQEQARTREEYNKAKIEAVQKEQAAKPEPTKAVNKRIRIRMIPIWLRLVLLAVALVVSLMSGAVVGYGVLGNGKAADVFKESTWTHIVDLVDKK